MKTNTIFTGAATALITPLNENGVDYPKMRELLEWQIAEGISALVICGTSGEGSTLSDDEHRSVLAFCKGVVGDRVPLIAGGALVALSLILLALYAAAGGNMSWTQAA